MIEYDVRTYLLTDATLTGYLASATGIYPDKAPQDEAEPFIVYSCANGVPDEILEEDLVTFRIASEDKAVTKNIVERIKTLLNKQDEIQGDITSSDYWIYYSKLGFHQSLSNTTDVENIGFDYIMTFAIKYKPKTWY